MMPKVKEKRFEDWSKLSSNPFVLYGDIEVILANPSDDDDGEKKMKKKTSVLQIHKPCAVGSYLVPHSTLSSSFFNSSYGSNQAAVKFHKGPGCVSKFCNYLNDLAVTIYNFNKKYCNKPQDRSNPREVEEYERSTHCQYCKSKFEKMMVH